VLRYVDRGLVIIEYSLRRAIAPLHGAPSLRPAAQGGDSILSGRPTDLQEDSVSAFMVSVTGLIRPPSQTRGEWMWQPINISYCSSTSSVPV